MQCNVCQRQVDAPVEEASVRSNVRKFRSESFVVWRCPHCQSLHAKDEVDLAHYYAHYPFHSKGDPKLDWVLHAMYRNQLLRLTRAGLKKDHRILDYGCGAGAFVEFLKSVGYANVVGFDEYSEKFTDRRVLDEQYDLVFSQDVLEHVADPWDLLREFQRLVRPGGIVSIGTPNAEDIDLKDPESRVHALHQPYHRNILSKRTLHSLGDTLGWELVRYYPTMFTNLLLPGVNLRFVAHYLGAHDNTIDLGLEPVQGSPKLMTLKSVYLFFFGYFHAPETDITIIFRAVAPTARLSS